MQHALTAALRMRKQGLGRNAGMWTIGLALSGSPAGWTLAEFEAATAAERKATRQRVSGAFVEAGAHLVIDTVADLLPALKQIEQWLVQGERP